MAGWGYAAVRHPLQKHFQHYDGQYAAEWFNSANSSFYEYINISHNRFNWDWQTSSHASYAVTAWWWDVCDWPWSEKKKKSHCCKPSLCLGQRPRNFDENGQTEQRLPCFPTSTQRLEGKQCTMQQRGHRNISAGLISPTDGRTIKSKGDVNEEGRAVVARQPWGCVDLPLPKTKQMRKVVICKTVEFLYQITIIRSIKEK